MKVAGSLKELKKLVSKYPRTAPLEILISRSWKIILRTKLVLRPEDAKPMPETAEVPMLATATPADTVATVEAWLVIPVVRKTPGCNISFSPRRYRSSTGDTGKRVLPVPTTKYLVLLLTTVRLIIIAELGKSGAVELLVFEPV